MTPQIVHNNWRLYSSKYYITDALAFFVVVVELLSCVQLLWPHGLQHTRLSFTISLSLLQLTYIESVMPSNYLILCCPLLLLPSTLSSIFASGGQSIGASASASVLPVNIQGWFPLGLTGLTSLLSKRLSRIFSSTTVQKHQFFSTQPLWSNSNIHTWLLGNP